MGADIHGWVEAKSVWLDDDADWFALINAGMLLDRNYAAFARLFGVRNYDNLPVLAHDRGFPASLSCAVKQEIKAITEKEDVLRLNGELFHSATWATWEELQTVDWLPFDESFRILRQLMEVLAQSKSFSQIRLVVWFDS